MNQSFSKVNAMYLKAHFGVQEGTNGSLQYNVRDQDYDGVWSTTESWIELGEVEKRWQVITLSAFQCCMGSSVYPDLNCSLNLG